MHIAGRRRRILASQTPATLLFVWHYNRENIEAQHYSFLMRGIYRWPMDSLHKQLVMWKAFPSHDVDMVHQEIWLIMRWNHVSCIIVNMSNNGTSANKTKSIPLIPRRCITRHPMAMEKTEHKSHYNEITWTSCSHHKSQRPVSRKNLPCDDAIMWFALTTAISFLGLPEMSKAGILENILSLRSCPERWRHDCAMSLLHIIQPRRLTFCKTPTTDIL